MDSKSRSFIVAPSGYDNMSAVLHGMGRGFEHTIITWNDLHNFNSLVGCEVLFINCASEAQSQANQIAPVVNKFVEQGGSLYASDYAGAILQNAFPGVLQFDQQGQTCQVDANVKDPGLQEIIGKKIPIHFDLGGWWRILNTDPSVRVYVDGGSPLNKIPIVVGFSHGRGHVIYTSFHNHAQVSEAEQRLLRFLVLRPILAQAAATVTKTVQSQLCLPGKEIIAAIDRNQPSTLYVYQAKGGESLLYVLHWTGTGKLRLTINNPAGQAVHRLEGEKPPLQYELPAVSVGNWSCQVEALNVPYNNFPYVLTLATRAQSKVQPVQETLWACYLLIDCSRSTSDLAPKIGQGISGFLRSLRGISAPGIVPAVSFGECRQSSSSISPLQRLSELSPLNLSCSGELMLEPSLTNLINVIENPAVQVRGKSLVVIVLTAEPCDKFQMAGDRLKQLAAQGRANIIAVGMNNRVSDSTLKRLATIPLRVSNSHSEGTTQCFDWIGRLSEAMLQSLSQSGEGKAISLPPLPSPIQFLS